MGKELQVAALKSGTAIDHIPSDQLFKVVKLLRLHELDNRITIGNNLDSRKMGTKGIIKISDKFFEEDEINRIALVAPKVKLNIIKNYEVVEKKRVSLMPTHFHVVDKDKVVLQCHYCEIKIDKEDIILSKSK